MTTVYCPSCDHESPAETPPCADDHGDACPECACLDCGAALLVEPAAA